MNNDSLFMISLYCKINCLIKCILICKQINGINNEYFWRIRKKIDYKCKKIIDNLYGDNYKLYYCLNKIKISLYSGLSLYRIYTINNYSSIKSVISGGFIPKEIKILINLKFFNDNFSNSYYTFLTKRLIAIPTEIGLLLNLERIDFENNNLLIIPTEIGNLINLTKLTLCFNRLQLLPTEIGRLTKLEHFSISQNRIHKLPSEIWQLSLQRLYIKNNPLKDKARICRLLVYHKINSDIL